MIRASGYRYAFRYFAFVQGITILIFAALLIKPVKTAAPTLPLKKICRGAELGVAGVFRSRVFWLIYLIYLLIAVGGMVMTAQLGPIARDFGLETQVVTVMGISMPLLAVAVSIDNFTNGITRPISGFLSDFLGRENMMLLMFSLEAAALLGMVVCGRSPSGFLLFASLIFLFWGEIFVVFPAICGDCAAARHSSSGNRVRAGCLPRNSSKLFRSSSKSSCPLL
jgi:MFS transporter, OFA family, oxalate/formate antiporter